MINLMYVVLMALLALNVPSDVLNGFSLINDSLLHSTANSTGENNDVYKDFAEYMKQNPEKVKAWYTKAMEVKHEADTIYNLIDQLKIEIAKEVEALYNVTVTAVNTARYAGKNKSRYTRSGLIKGRTNAFKKAFVTLKEGDTIDFYSNI